MLIALLILGGLAYAAQFDPSWSAAAKAAVQPGGILSGGPATTLGLDVEYFLLFMDRSLFEGEGFGAGDISIIVQIVAFLLYGASFLRRAPEGLRQLRPVLAYLWVSALATAAGVHLFKGVIARPRPYEVAQGVSEFHLWYDLQMPRFFAFAKGSFPSGHTAGAATLWTVVLALGWLYPQRLVAVRIFAFISIVFCLSMAFSRVAHGDHWPTDTLAAMVFTFAVATLLGRTMLSTPRGSAASCQDRDLFTRDLVTLFWCCGLWLTTCAFYVALKLFASGDPVLGAAACMAFFGGVYGTCLARVRGLRS